MTAAPASTTPSPAPRPAVQADRRASAVNRASVRPAAARASGAAPLATRSVAPRSSSRTSAERSPRAPAVSSLSPTTGGHRHPRHEGAAGKERGEQHRPGGREQPPGDQDRQPTGDDRARDGEDDPEGEVLHGVDVGDHPGQEIAAPEAGKPLRRQHFEAPPDRHPDVGQGTEHCVVGDQSLAVAEEPAADAERTDGHHGDPEGQHRRHLRRPRDEPAAHPQEPDRTDGREGCEQSGPGELGRGPDAASRPPDAAASAQRPRR